MTGSDGVLMGRAELERAFTRLGERLVRRGVVAAAADGRGREWLRFAGRQPAAPRPSAAAQGRARRVRAASRGGDRSRSLRLRWGRNDSRMAGAPSAPCGPWVVAQGHPASRRPGQAEQTPARPASVRTCVKVRLTWRTGRRPAPRRAGRRQTGWQPGLRVGSHPLPPHQRHGCCERQ